MKTLTLDQLRSIVRPHLDALQFAYQPRIGVEDAIIYLLNRVYTQYNQACSTGWQADGDAGGSPPPLWPGLWIT